MYSTFTFVHVHSKTPVKTNSKLNVHLPVYVINYIRQKEDYLKSSWCLN